MNEYIFSNTAGHSAVLILHYYVDEHCEQSSVEPPV